MLQLRSQRPLEDFMLILRIRSITVDPYGCAIMHVRNTKVYHPLKSVGFACLLIKR